MQHLDRDFLDQIKAVAEAAGHATLPIYRSDFDVETKEDDSPLTQADLAAHAVIRDGLAAIDDEVEQLSEEGADVPFATRNDWDEYWLIDPLDGTREFVNGKDEFTINIALIQDNRPSLGVVYAPALERCWFAAETVGAFEQRGDNPPQPIQTSVADPAKPRVLASRSHRSDAVENILARMADYETVSIGSSLKFCLIASGEADFYPRLGPTSEWDTAAGQAVVSVAGGGVTDTAGYEMEYNQTESLLNNAFIAYGDRSHNWLGYLDSDD
ncbi:3'(2'),5'-bisphosphate nucleotidase CysQ [Salinisphaera orenii]|uniref:3'(2'),5'-bisphosphate nucleotidase CysQ n=1 Tax=Salinisphaera orenii TaxID=856731 RepID=UPI000DBE0C85